MDQIDSEMWDVADNSDIDMNDTISDDDLVKLADDAETCSDTEMQDTINDNELVKLADDAVVMDDDNKFGFDSSIDDIELIKIADEAETAHRNGQDVQYGEGRRPREKKPLFQVINHSVEFYKKFKTTGTCYNLKITDPDPKEDPGKWITDLLEGIISYFKNNSKIEVKSGDRIGMSLKNSVCDTEPIYIGIRRSDQLAADVILTHIMNIFASNQSFFLNGHLTIHFDHIQMPHGSGGDRKIGQTNVDFIDKKACYLKYKNPGKEYMNDEYCLPYALVLSRAFTQFKNGEKKRSFFQKYQDTFSTLRREAEKLCREADVEISQIRGGCSFDEVKKFQRILPNYQIVIFSRDSIKPMYTDERYNDKDKLNIMLHQNHYSAMRSIKACFGVNHICIACYSVVHSAVEHVFKYACFLCQAKPKCNPTNKTIECKKCYRNFYGQECYKNHLKMKGKKSVCQVKKNCPKCKSSLEKKHKCGKRMCITCDKLVDRGNHLCYMPKYETKRSDDDKYLYVMYDLETQQNSLMNPNDSTKFKHVPNLCVSQSQCTNCIDVDDISINCEDCGMREYIYHNTNCVVNLMDYLVEKSNETEERLIDGKTKKVPKFDKIILIAHNSSGFDAQFILKYIYDSDRFPNPDVIMNGTKIIEIKIGSRIKFIDSLIYFQKPLSELPKLFGFEGGKGYYPHFFNTPENENYKGKIPEKHYYGYNSMKPEQRAAFKKWHRSMCAKGSKYEFINKKEIVEYCRMDVTILRKACIKFVKDFWEKNQIDPFIDGSTIASICNKVFRSNYLLSLEIEHNIEIQHAGRGREYIIPDIGRCDGYSATTRTIFEFHGCYWHTCTKCFPGDYESSPLGEEMRKRRDDTLTKEKAIINAGYNLIVKRECDFKRELEEKPELAVLLSNHPMIANEPLNPREAFYGGRTNANKLYFESDGKSKMAYYDICSLYPFINKTAKCPKGHAKVYVGDQCLEKNWMEMDGLMKVTVRPPRGLKFPVLPSRHHKRLMFALCNTCVVTLNQCKCEHNDAQREFTGTYVMDEVKLAVSKNYEIVKIHEIWEYEITQYDPKTGEGGFFSGYINNFLKIKAEASGIPSWCTTPELEDKYIKDFYDREGILLDKTKIVKNAPLRGVSKLMLNSFWGRFGMRTDLLRTKVVQTGEELRDLILNPKIDVHSILSINDEKMLVNYKVKEEARTPNSSTNVVIAAFTTAYARMELYKYLDLLGWDRVWYYDTDSVLFSYKDGDVMPEKGDFLGQMTDELDTEEYGPGAYIIAFVSGGPKNYAFKIYSPTKNKIFVIVKAKGITLNYENSKILDFEMMKRMVSGKGPESLELSIDGIRRTNFADVYSTRVKKSYSINYTKRQLNVSDFTTLPYGY